jgi:hypothetical protein
MQRSELHAIRAVTRANQSVLHKQQRPGALWHTYAEGCAWISKVTHNVQVGRSRACMKLSYEHARQVGNHTWQLYTSHQHCATSTVAQAAAQQHLQVLTAESRQGCLNPEVSRRSASTYTSCTARNTLDITSAMSCARPACSSARLRCWFQPND